MIKKFLSLFLLTSVLVIGVFGFASINHGVGHNIKCTASILSNTQCPENITAMLIHHMQAFASFFNIVPSIPLVFLFSVFLSIVFFYTKHQDSILDSQTFWHFRCNLEHKRTRSWKIDRWLSLFKNSPPLNRISITISNLKNLCKQKHLKIMKNIQASIRQRHSILFAEWSLMWIKLRQAQIIRAKPITFVLSTARITLRPIP